MGFLSFLGVVLACPSCFLGLLGFSAFLVVLLLLVGVGAGCGGSGVRGLVRPGGLLPFRGGRVGGLLPFRGGWAWGCACVRPVPELSGSGCGRGRWPGSGVCASPGSCCVVVGVGLCPVSCSCSRCCCRVRGGFSGVVFSVRCFSCSPGFRCWSSWSCRGSGGCGGCRVGFGVVFSPASVVLARACFRFPFVGGWFGFGLGFVWRV